MTDDTESRGPNRAQRIIAWPFVLVGTLGFLGVAGLLIADVFFRYGANAPIRGAQEMAGAALAGLLAVGLPAAAILGIRSGGPTHAPPLHRWWTALHTSVLFLIEALAFAGLGLLMLVHAVDRYRAAETTMQIQLSLGLVETAVGAGLLVAAVFVLLAGAIRLVRGR